MDCEKKQPSGSGQKNSFLIGGKISREQPECQPGELKLAAYVFDKAGSLLGCADIDEKGGYKVAVRLAQPVNVDLFVDLADMQNQIRHSSAYRKTFSAREWKGEGAPYRLRFDALLPVDVWIPWWPLHICISGHVRKVSHADGVTNICPVPFVKVEIFDVDRENCFWPPLRKWWKLLLDRPVIRIPELLKETPVLVKPFPGPYPAPELNLRPISDLSSSIGASRLAQVSLNPQPLPPAGISASFTNFAQADTTRTEITSAAARYYRLSYAREGSSEFTPVTASLADTRVAKATLFSETHTLGPKTINGVPALYEVRNFSDYYWYNPDWLGTWYSWLAEADTGKYILRLEVFDQNGLKLTSVMGVDYRDGTVPPPAVLPPMPDRCDLVIILDNGVKRGRFCLLWLDMAQG